MTTTAAQQGDALFGAKTLHEQLQSIFQYNVSDCMQFVPYYSKNDALMDQYSR